MYLPAPDEAIWIGTLRLVLRVPGSRSLKDKRRAILSVRDRLVARHHVSVAEVGHLDNHDMAVLAVAAVGNDSRLLRSRLDAIRGEADGRADVLLVDSQVDIIAFAPDLSRVRD